MPSHGIARQGVGGTAALAKTQIGANIEFPAGGPWSVFGLWMQVIQDTAAAAESLAGSMVIDALSGDIKPNPAPGTFPVPGLPSIAGANAGLSTVPLVIFPMAWQAAGKAIMSISYVQQLAQAVGAQVACGVLFGDSVPVVRPVVLIDGVRSTQTAEAETAVGTITLSTRSTRITGILADINIDAGWTADEGAIGIIRLGSADADMPPSQWPLMRAFSAGDGTPVGGFDNTRFQFIPVDIPVPSGARIDTFIDLGIAMTNAVTVGIYLMYE